MNLERLQWTKNVRPDEGWAYSQFKKSELFKLAWRDAFQTQIQTGLLAI